MANKRVLLVEDDRAVADLIAFHFERAADHAVNIAEMVHYAATGRHMADPKAGK